MEDLHPPKIFKSGVLMRKRGGLRDLMGTIWMGLACFSHLSINLGGSDAELGLWPFQKASSDDQSIELGVLHF